MKILIIGSGGREHALAWKLAQSPRVTQLWCAPGNSGIKQVAELAELKANNIAGLCALAGELKIDLTIVGPEEPLALGIVDYFREDGHRIFGPDKKAAQLEASKTFSKRLMKKYGIPTAEYEEFDRVEAALDYLKSAKLPRWVKADGLAAGKGAIFAGSREEAEATVKMMMQERVFGEAGRRIIIEESLAGPEATIMAFAAGKDFFVMPAAQDHKPVFDNDQGPNTGGMGCYSPVPVVTPELHQQAQDKIIAPILKALVQEGRPYYGLLYAGLMLTKDGWKVIEFNSRFGDPETQVILPLLENDLLDIIEPIAAGKLGEAPRWSERAATCVVMASGGYPGEFEKKKEIFGLEEAAKLEDVVVFHAATWGVRGRFYTNGGRVLGVTGIGDNLAASVKRVYDAVDKISWEGVHYRRDIAAKALGGR